MSNTFRKAGEGRIVVLGGGFGGMALVRHLERARARRKGVDVVLLSRDNFFLLTPFLFEACVGTLELRHCTQPIRSALTHARFVEASVTGVDAEERIVRATAPDGARYELRYDHLVVALGATTNMSLIPGSHLAFTFKTTADALLLRNHMIERFERADVEEDRDRRRRLLSVVIVGGGLVGVELLGELSAFADEITRYYPRIDRSDVRFHLFEFADRILPEVKKGLAEYAIRVLRARGADIRASTPVRAIERGRVLLDGETVDADTIVITAGIVPSPATSAVPVERDERGRIVVDAAFRSVSDPRVWALGDCAAAPSPDGGFYPALAQHAIREGRSMARNLMRVLSGEDPEPFVYHSLGTMASLGHTRAVVQVGPLRITGFPAWWFRRTYYLFQLPSWARRLRVVLDWTVALMFRPDTGKVELAVEEVQKARDSAAGTARPEGPLRAPRSAAREVSVSP